MFRVRVQQYVAADGSPFYDRNTCMCESLQLETRRKARRRRSGDPFEDVRAGDSRHCVVSQPIEPAACFAFCRDILSLVWSQ